MKYDQLLAAKITQNIDENYRTFHVGIVPGTTLRGVRIPVLRQIAKEFSTQHDFLANVTLDNYEAVSVACYYIGYTTKDVALLKTRLDFILPYVNNWAICDTFVSTLKILKTKAKTAAYPLIISYLASEHDYTVRFALVCLLSYYLHETVIADLFAKIIPLQGRSYYVDMALAWLIATAFVKCRTQTIQLLQSKVLNAFVQNKSISKINDSLRVSPADKQLLKSYRQK